jgi:hypothetical protein
MTIGVVDIGGLPPLEDQCLKKGRASRKTGSTDTALLKKAEQAVA